MLLFPLWIDGRSFGHVFASVRNGVTDAALK